MKKKSEILSHGMEPEKASKVKLAGHKLEDIFSQYIDSEKIRSTKKKDVEDVNGKCYSIKGGFFTIRNGREVDGRWQVFLYKKSHFEGDSTFPGRDIILRILNLYPADYTIYQNNKLNYKKKIAPLMVEYKDFLLENPKNIKKLFEKAFFGNNVDFLVSTEKKEDHFEFHIFTKDDIGESSAKNLLVVNSVQTNRTNVDHQKVVFKYPRENPKIIIEFEVRTTNDGKYPSILFNCSKNKIMPFFKETIPLKKIIKKKNLDLAIFPSSKEKTKFYLYGEADDYSFPFK